MESPVSVDAVRQALGKLCPNGVSYHAEWASDAFALNDEEGAHLEAATEHRRREFATGRHCLRSALEQCGFFNLVISSDSDGVPIIPEGSLASLSHSRGLCVAVAASTSSIQILGIDIEKTTRLSPAAMLRVVHSLETDWVGANRIRASLLFSAKEAFYKAQYVRSRCLGSFHDLALKIDEERQTAKALYLGEQFPSEMKRYLDRLHIRYQYVGEYVMTLCWLS
ncbi:MAG TPA: hypothetical protein DCX06_01190 [Opitutae bacterium]|nr:hypothetical protein [Opitutae bacterium]